MTVSKWRSKVSLLRHRCISRCSERKLMSTLMVRLHHRYVHTHTHLCVAKRREEKCSFCRWRQSIVPRSLWYQSWSARHWSKKKRFDWFELKSIVNIAWIIEFDRLNFHVRFLCLVWWKFGLFTSRASRKSGEGLGIPSSINRYQYQQCGMRSLSLSLLSEKNILSFFPFV